MKYFAVFIALFVFSSVNCVEESRLAAPEKFYIHPSQISISEGGIFVRIEDEWFPAEALHADTCGIYASGLVDSARIDTNWHCTLGHQNEWWRIHCKQCGRRVGEK
jgi:hypothetical protein